MAVFIKNFEMPTSCWSCKCCDGYNAPGLLRKYFCSINDLSRDLNDNDMFEKRPDWRPLVEVDLGEMEDNVNDSF